MVSSLARPQKPPNENRAYRAVVGQFNQRILDDTPPKVIVADRPRDDRFVRRTLSASLSIPRSRQLAAAA